MEKANQLSTDPWLSQFPKFFLGLSYIYSGNFQKAEEQLREIISFSQKFGVEGMGTPAQGLLGAVLVAKGQMARGIALLEDVQRKWLKNKSRWRYIHSEFVFGNIYSKLAERAAPISLLTIIKNLGFLAKNVPFAYKKAEYHFHKAIEAAKETGANGMLGQAYLDLGLLHKAKGKKIQAEKCLAEAIRYFEQCEAETFQRKAKETLASLS
jgi:tetratricopeptide (TPR) repeat protein